MAQAASGYVSQDTAPPPPHTAGERGGGRKFRARMEEGRVETLTGNLFPRKMFFKLNGGGSPELHRQFYDAGYQVG
jgi:hypothetical protein